jgi:tetratricopeptide (TPR) repeat protein
MAASDPRELVGATVAGRYAIRAFVGEGTLSAIYEAERIADHAPCMLKVLLPQLGGDAQLAARFVREGKALGMFQHPNIVELREVGEGDGGMLFIVTDRVTGTPLRAVIDAGPVETARAIAIVRQVLDALGHAHARGVIHRDIKPDNIMLGDGDTVKILEFGVAKLLHDTSALLSEAQLTQTGITMFGDPRYLAPEAVLGRAVDPRADLYSVGAMLFELITGAPPFHDPDPAKLIRLHASATPPTLADAGREVTPQLELVVAEALGKQPELRFASAAEMIEALDRARISFEPSPVPADAPWTGRPVLQRPLAEVRHPPAPRWRLPARPRWLVRPAWLTRRVLIAGGGGLAIVLLVIVIAATRSSAKPATAAAQATGAASELLRHAADLAAAGNHAGAAELLERELATGAASDGATWMALGQARIALGRRADAIAAYERAIALAPALAGNATIRANVAAILDTRDTAAAMLALELLARGVAPPAADAIVAQASTGKLAEVRHRAFAIAERDGFADRIDHVESWSLDLKQAATCEERRTAIVKLRGRADKRALPALRRILQLHRCVEREATDAIAQLEAR